MSDQRPKLRFNFGDFRSRRRPRQNLPTLPLRILIPNVLTLMALAAGLTAVRFALDGRFEAAVLAIVAAAIIDGLDGRIARLLNGVSRFGAELDSLSDFVSFGISPAFVIYLWSLHQAKGIGWPVVLFYSMCMALRLARFNTALDDPNKPAWSVHFFTGVPAPTGAAIVMLPIYLDFQGIEWLRDWPSLVALHMIAVGLLLVSRLPTPSFKRISVDREHVLPSLVVVVAVGALVATIPWTTLTLVILAYLAYLPRSLARYRTFEAQPPEPQHPEPQPTPAASAPDAQA
jgi:CDP-diacylglycerol--serine O-phosphatidyltransferase